MYSNEPSAFKVSDEPTLLKPESRTAVNAPEPPESLASKPLSALTILGVSNDNVYESGTATGKPVETGTTVTSPKVTSV